MDNVNKANFMNSLISFLKDNLTIAVKNYANFKGRATRQEYFSLILCFFVLLIAAAFLNIIPFLGTLILIVLILASIVPLLAVTVRRLHDVNQPGWLAFVPLAIFVLSFLKHASSYTRGLMGTPFATQILSAAFALFNAYLAYLVIQPSDKNSAYGSNENLPEPLKLEFVDAMKKIYLHNYYNFKGRASRKEYWWPVYFFYFMFAALVNALCIIPYLGPVVSAILTAAFIIPNLALCARRMHDINLSGWFALIPYVGLALAGILLYSGFSNPEEAFKLKITLGFFLVFGGYIAMIVLALRVSDPKENRFGPVPEDVDVPVSEDKALENNTTAE